MTTLLPERENIVGSVNLYHRHLYICSGQTAWPAEIEQDGGFLSNT
jgi:hypothetical protein